MLCKICHCLLLCTRQRLHEQCERGRWLLFVAGSACAGVCWWQGDRDCWPPGFATWLPQCWCSSNWLVGQYAAAAVGHTCVTHSYRCSAQHHPAAWTARTVLICLLGLTTPISETSETSNEREQQNSSNRAHSHQPWTTHNSLKPKHGL